MTRPPARAARAGAAWHHEQEPPRLDDRAAAQRLHPRPDDQRPRRLRLGGLIHRIEHTNRYVLTPDGIKFAVFYTKLYNRLLRPLMAADQAQAPPELRQALDVISHHVDDHINRTRLGKAA